MRIKNLKMILLQDEKMCVTIAVAFGEEPLYLANLPFYHRPARLFLSLRAGRAFFLFDNLQILYRWRRPKSWIASSCSSVSTDPGRKSRILAIAASAGWPWRTNQHARMVPVRPNPAVQ